PRPCAAFRPVCERRHLSPPHRRLGQLAPRRLSRNRRRDRPYRSHPPAVRQPRLQPSPCRETAARHARPARRLPPPAPPRAPPPPRPARAPTPLAGIPHRPPRPPWPGLGGRGAGLPAPLAVGERVALRSPPKGGAAPVLRPPQPPRTPRPLRPGGERGPLVES